MRCDTCRISSLLSSAHPVGRGADGLLTPERDSAIPETGTFPSPDVTRRALSITLADGTYSPPRRTRLLAGLSPTVTCHTARWRRIGEISIAEPFTIRPKPSSWRFRPFIAPSYATRVHPDHPDPERQRTFLKPEQSGTYARGPELPLAVGPRPGPGLAVCSPSRETGISYAVGSRARMTMLPSLTDWYHTRC